MNKIVYSKVGQCFSIHTQSLFNFLVISFQAHSPQNSLPFTPVFNERLFHISVNLQLVFCSFYNCAVFFNRIFPSVGLNDGRKLQVLVSKSSSQFTQPLRVSWPECLNQIHFMFFPDFKVLWIMVCKYRGWGGVVV